MFLLISNCHVGAHPNEHQRGVSIQNSIDLGKSSPNISNMKNCTNLNLGEGVWTDLPPFISDPESGVMYWTVLMFMTV